MVVFHVMLMVLMEAPELGTIISSGKSPERVKCAKKAFFPNLHLHLILEVFKRVNSL